MMRFATTAQMPTERFEVSTPKESVSAPGMRKVVTQPSITPPAKLELFEEIILPHLNSAYNLARWLTRNEHDAQDVVQESYLRTFRFFDGYHGGDPKAWLLAVVRNTCHTWRRREKRDVTKVLFDEADHTPDLDAPDAEERLVEATKMNTLRHCIETLPVEFREVLVMRELEEMSYQQVAEVANLPVGTVMSRLSRARKRLEECAGRRKSGADK